MTGYTQRFGRPVAGTALAMLLLGGCAGSSPGRPVDGPPDASAALRQTVDELRREVAELRAELEAHRRVSAMARDLLGLRAELEAVHAAIQALIRDLEQRQVEGAQTADRRLTALATRVDELAARLRRTEGGVGEPAAPRGADAGAALPPAAPALPPPPPAAPAAKERVAREPSAEVSSAVPTRPSRLQRVRAAESAGETRVIIEADGALAPRVFRLADPPRLVLDLENAAFGFERTPIGVNGAVVERIRFIQLRSVPTPAIRLVVSVKRLVPFWVESQDRRVILHLGASAPAR